MKTIDISNQKFGRLTAIEKSTNISGKTVWKCICDCGKIAYVTTSNLTCNRIRSCGCIKQEILMKRNITHNQRHTKLYNVWKGIKQRCYNPKSQSYHNYGARGIKMCNEWLNDFQSFYEWSYANGYSTENQNDEKHKLTLDRIDVNGNYEPSNCRWVDRKTQASNMRTTKLITINGQTKSIAEWCRTYNVYRTTFNARVKRGLSPYEALTK